MRPLFSPAGLARVQRALREAPLLAFDWDGTLVPIAVRPEEARINRATAQAFRSVVGRWPTAIVSGRSRTNLRALTRGLGRVVLIGNHGMEAGVPDRRVLRWRRQVARWRRQLRPLERTAGFAVEAKGLSLSIHYRASEDWAKARQSIRAALHPLEGAQVIVGKAVVNVLPTDAPDKGSAVRQLARRLHRRSIIFVGDDLTDENAFRLAQQIGLIGVRVGWKEGSAARWFIRTQADVLRLLRLLAGF
jgi:trehalose 6-phosphate phosphatase